MSNSVSLDQLPPIDFADALNRIGGDRSFLKELLDIYFREYAEKRPHLEEAITRLEYVRVSELGHSLKGASANLSLPRLQKVAYTLETAGREKKIQLIKETVLSLEAEVEALKNFLESHPLC
jgi:two-component system, sensor histidine kinase and response regulator